jgi:hypothetical protein
MYFYQSGNECVPCPDSTLSIILFVILAIAVVCVGLIVTAIQTPQMQAAVKGLTVMISFFQGFVSLKFLKIPWPDITLQLFDIMSILSFSLEGINPECTIRFDFRTKTLLTLAAPFGIAAVIVIICLVFGVRGCHKLRAQLHQKVAELRAQHAGQGRSKDSIMQAYLVRRREAQQRRSSAAAAEMGIKGIAAPRATASAVTGTLMSMRIGTEEAMMRTLLAETSVFSLFRCWIAVVFFRRVEFDPRVNTSWFALCPILITRLKTRMERSAKENWEIAKLKLKMRYLIRSIHRSKAGSVPDPTHDVKLTSSLSSLQYRFSVARLTPFPGEAFLLHGVYQAFRPRRVVSKAVRSGPQVCFGRVLYIRPDVRWKRHSRCSIALLHFTVCLFQPRAATQCVYPK